MRNEWLFMPKKCPSCGSTNFREALGGTVCAECGTSIDKSTAPEIGAEIRESDAYPSADSGLMEVGDFRVNSSEIERATEMHNDRPEFNQERDENNRARITTDIDLWASDMDSFDFPGVDTPKKKPNVKEKDKPFLDEDSVLSNLFE